MADVESIWYSYTVNELLSVTKARFPTMHILFDHLLPAQAYPCVVVMLYCSDEGHIYIKASSENIVKWKWIHLAWLLQPQYMTDYVQKSFVPVTDHGTGSHCSGSFSEHLLPNFCSWRPKHYPSKNEMVQVVHEIRVLRGKLSPSCYKLEVYIYNPHWFAIMGVLRLTDRSRYSYCWWNIINIRQKP